ncbi:MAG: phosphocholine cytidylyltransferase family protein [Bdellovibrionota bacterium]
MAKIILLAAGKGSRLKPLTDDRPKCMVEYQGKPLLRHLLETIRCCGLRDITVVDGYQATVIDAPDCKRYSNTRFDSTNMVESLFSAESELSGDDVIVSYTDIIYLPRVLKAIINAKDEFSVVIDTKWRQLWKQRMEDPLQDAETLKLDSAGYIIELGKKPQTYDDIQGQYIGLFKIRADALETVCDFYHALDRTQSYDGKDFENMYMTTFIQLIIDKLMPVRAVKIDGGWLEVDAPSDLNLKML